MDSLGKFIIKAKANGWVAAEPGGVKIAPSRKDSLDITFEEGEYFYQDSFVGLSDFCGQEHVTLKNAAVWSMAYYGYLLKPDSFSGLEVVRVLKAALATMYKEGKFLGGFSYRMGAIEYRDTNSGDYKRFDGIERILSNDEPVYELRYFGGLVRK